MVTDVQDELIVLLGIWMALMVSTMGTTAVLLTLTATMSSAFIYNFLIFIQLTGEPPF